jgi:hypothetical protein
MSLHEFYLLSAYVAGRRRADHKQSAYLLPPKIQDSTSSSDRPRLRTRWILKNQNFPDKRKHKDDRETCSWTELEGSSRERKGATHVTATYKMADAKEKVKKMAK